MAFFFIFSSENVTVSEMDLISIRFPPYKSGPEHGRSLLDPSDVRLPVTLLRPDSELLRELRQVAAASFGYGYKVFYADAAHFRIVDAGLYGDDVARDELLVDLRDSGGLVALQSGVVHLLQPVVRFALDEGASHV